MSWGSPHLLWLLCLLAVAAALRWLWVRRILRKRSAVGAGVTHLTRTVARGRTRMRALLLWTGFAAAILAAAQPRWGHSDEVRGAKGCDLLVLLDCSESMMATDLYPTRIEAARRKAIDLLNLAPETRMALMPFAAIPVLRCPLTGDHDALAQMLQDCSPDLFPASEGYQGTAIGKAVMAGLHVLGKPTDRGEAIVVMSDGADDDQKAVASAAQAAKDAGIPIYGLFFADPTRKATLVIDGKEEVMDADRSTLDTLASTTGGICINAGNDLKDVELLHDHLVHHVTQMPWQERQRIVASERYNWFLLPAIALIALGLLLPTRRRLAEEDS